MPFTPSLLKSFYSGAFYTDLAMRGKGIGIKFILFRILMAMVIIALPLMHALPHARTTIESLFARMPDITLENNKLSMDQPSPYTIDINANADAKKQALIVFNTSPQTVDVQEIKKNMEDQNIAVFITSDFVAIQKSNHGLEIHSFSDYAKAAAGHKKIEMHHDNWVALGNKFMAWGAPLIFVMCLFFMFIGEFVIAIFRAVVVTIIGLFFKIKPDFSGTMRVGVAASVPTAVIGTLLFVLSFCALQKPPYYTLPSYGYVLIWFCLVVYGLIAINKDNNNNVLPS